MHSMIEPSVTELLEKVDNRYRLVTVTARRARQILDGSPLLTEFDSNKPLSIAINEVNEGLIHYETLKDGVK
ncbi:DNA-directed RNA polymerase subunit omega [Youngiibacter multivorans]|uniref:DNA-directed RNA polymerase subunit omega n=1 Tax=Youngiibacter multivorans TaxID=937251 RepID=A0ABS4G2J6_9CLOT|nr:DNA-directed RNA polymerase subunit omega [Youngiibacter multivorans]MBP1918575.1 DNA-directed RNA polymerase subunit omega [Youngiibacter multivorans]